MKLPIHSKISRRHTTVKILQGKENITHMLALRAFAPPSRQQAILRNKSLVVKTCSSIVGTDLICNLLVLWEAADRSIAPNLRVHSGTNKLGRKPWETTNKARKGLKIGTYLDMRLWPEECVTPAWHDRNTSNSNTWEMKTSQSGILGQSRLQEKLSSETGEVSAP